MGEADNTVEVKLTVSTEIAKAMRRGEGLTHQGTVTLRLDDSDQLTVWFSEPFANWHE